MRSNDNFQSDKGFTMGNAFDPLPTLSDLHQAAVRSICDLATQCVSQRGRFTVSLSGGSTPKRIYELLSEEALPWDKIHLFWGDERNVPHDHADSNFRMVHQALISRVEIPSSNVHAVPVQVESPDQAAAAYESTLREVFQGQAFPQWDLALLGMGDDAHTASLFPHTDALKETERWFVSNWVEKFDAYRYTLTAPAINSAQAIWFLVSGEKKQQALASVLGEDQNTALYPSQLIQPHRWFVTADAVQA